MKNITQNNFWTYTSSNSESKSHWGERKKRKIIKIGLALKIRIQQIQLLCGKILARIVFFQKPRENTELAVISIVQFMEEKL